MRFTALAAALALPLFGQVPDEAFFKGEPRAIMLACAEKVRNLKSMDSRLCAEIGRSYLAAGDRARAEEAFRAGLADDPIDAPTYRIIGESWLMFGYQAEGLAVLKLISPRFRIKEHGRPWIETELPYDNKDDLTKGAVALAGAGLPKEADELMEVAYNLDRGEWENATLYARACLRAGRPECAAKWLYRAVKSKPRNESIWIDAALSLADPGSGN